MVVRLPSAPWLCAVFALVLAGSVLRIIKNQMHVCVINVLMNRFDRSKRLKMRCSERCEKLSLLRSACSSSLGKISYFSFITDIQRNNLCFKHGWCNRQKRSK